MGENGDFQPLHPKISRNSQTVSNMRTRLLLTINYKFSVDLFAKGLHTRTAVTRLPLHQLDFLVVYGKLQLTLNYGGCLSVFRLISLLFAAYSVNASFNLRFIRQGCYYRVGQKKPDHF